MDKIIFLDRDGTVIVEPEDGQIDTLEKLELMPEVIPALLKLKHNGYQFVMVSNQDGLGTEKYPLAAYKLVQDKMLTLFKSQGIEFSDVLICPHFEEDNCDCRKPKLGLVMDYMRAQKMDLQNSYFIGDRATDVDLADQMGIKGILIDGKTTWNKIAHDILSKNRAAKVHRKTGETDISVEINLDGQGKADISTGIGFFDHCLEQLAKHGGFNLSLKATGDTHVDLHHTIEDTALAIGEAIRIALGDKIGISRYGFVLPMDEARATVAVDLCNRTYFELGGNLGEGAVGEFPIEMTPHFFRSLSDALRATMHIEIKGDNAHHMVEAIFKGVAKTLKMACARTEDETLPSTKGML